MHSSGDDNQPPMNPSDTQKKVVEFSRGGLPPTTINRAREILNVVAAAAMVPLLKLLAGVFETTDDSLFDRTDRAGDSDAQQKFFEALREVRRKRPVMEKAFQDRLRAYFSDYSAGKVIKPMVESGPEQDGELSLALVEESALEESLATDAMTSRAETRFSQLLFHLSQRCATLVPKQKPEDLTPLAPRVLCDVFTASCKDLQVTLEVKLIVLKLFERKVMDALDPVYIEANRVLVEAGILPQLKYSFPKGARGTSGAPGQPGQPGGPESGEMDGSPGQPQGTGHAVADGGQHYTGDYAHEFQQLQSMMSQRRQALYQANPGLGALPIMPGNQLLDAASILQNDFAAMLGGDQLPPVMLANQMKQALLQQVAKLSGSTKQRLNSGDEDAIDLVGMLFDFVLGDRNLPAQVQAVLARLQVPYLKVALLDRHLFSQRQHPARKLLDELAQAYTGWTEEADRDGRLIQKLREIVENVISKFEKEIDLFENLHQDFHAFQTQHRRRSELAEQRAAETAQGREKLEAARLAATRAVHARTTQRALPEVVREIITGPWAKYLELTHARKGPDSSDWRAALQFMDDLLWTVDIRQIAIDEARWHRLKPDVEQQLQQGLQLVGYHNEDAHRLASRLRTHYGNIAAGAEPDLPSEPDVGGPPPSQADILGEVDGLQITGAAPATEGGVQIRAEIETAGAEGMTTAANEHLQAVRQLKVGTWVEFLDDKGVKTRAKLSWVSPISEKYLFVNQNGVKIAEKSIYDFAADLKEQRASVLQQAPLFDRALDAIMRRLRANPAKIPVAPGTPQPKPA